MPVSGFVKGFGEAARQVRSLRLHAGPQVGVPSGSLRRPCVPLCTGLFLVQRMAHVSPNRVIFHFRYKIPPYFEYNIRRFPRPKTTYFNDSIKDGPLFPGRLPTSAKVARWI
jgi:hypothetical protein